METPASGPTRTWGEWASGLNPFKTAPTPAATSSTYSTGTTPSMGGRKRRATGKSKGKKARRVTRRSGRKSTRS